MHLFNHAANALPGTRLTALLVLLALPLTGLAADALPTTRLLPVVTTTPEGAPLSAEERSTPFLAHVGDLAALGYIEEEYELAGTGNIYDYVDDAAQSPEVAITESAVPYVTRMLIRRPVNPSAFNGTVYLEILNSTEGYDNDPLWRLSYPYLVRAGAIYVGITSDPLTIEFLRDRWGAPEFAPRNRERYANLTMDRFGQVWDVLSQSAALLRDSASPANPLAGLNVERIIQAGYSQSAGFVKTYANSMHSRDIAEYGFAAYDGYFLSVGGFSAKKINPPLPNDGPNYLGFDDVRRLVAVAAPVIRFQTETEMIAIFAAETGRQVETGLPGGPEIRTYEMAGGVHGDLRLENSARLIGERDLGIPPVPPACALPVIPLDVGVIQSALLHALDVWIRDGTEPPPSQLIDLGTNDKLQTVVLFDENGNATGGLRSPQIEVPLGRYIANPFTLLNACFLNGGFVAFDEARFRELYPTDGDYVRAADREISRAVADRILLQEDAGGLRQTMLTDAGITESDTNSSDDGDNAFGCTLASNRQPDPLFPVLVTLALAYLVRRHWPRH